MRVSYSPGYVIPLPDGHAFPMSKFSAFHFILSLEGLIDEEDVHAPEPVSWDDLRLVHTEGYLTALHDGTLTAKEERKLGLPWSAGLYQRSRLAVQGSLNAARFALEDGISANLAGGTHHAFPDHGEGFCVLNDIGVAICVLQREGVIRRALVIDLDVHQGNGTAAVFNDDPDVYTFSMHGERNYPWHKTPSSCDVGLPDSMNDDAYLKTLTAQLPLVLDVAQPDLVIYVGGVDVVEGDRFGRLALTRKGLHRRERLVLETTRLHDVPLLLVMGGGYAKTPELTADLHAVVHREARRVYGV